MRMIELDLHPDRDRLRQFGWVALAAFGLLGAWVLWRGHLFGIDLDGTRGNVAIGLWSAASISALFSLIWPSGNRVLYVLLTVIAFPIGTVISYVLMAFLFYVVITPVGLWFRVVRRDVLDRRFEPKAKSYWSDHRSPDGLQRYFKQF
jgi:hypothetical protein